VVCKVGGTVDDSEMVEGMVFDQKAAKTAGGPTRMEKAKLGLIQFCISPPKADIESNVVISDYTQVGTMGGGADGTGCAGCCWQPPARQLSNAATILRT
jgi:hypothetical protein